MAATEKKTNDTLSDLDCLRAVFVQNLPSDVTEDLLQCLFPEASEVKLNVDRHGNYKRRSSIILFPKVSHALYYADQDRSIKLDAKLLSIQSMVHPESSSPSRKKDYTSPSNSQVRNHDHDKERNRDRPSHNSRRSNHPRSPSQKSSKRSLSPSYHHKRIHSSQGKERKVLVQNLPIAVNRSTVFSLIPNAKDISIGIDESKASAFCVVEFFTEKEAEVFLKQSHHIQLDRHVLIAEPYKIDKVDKQLNLKLRARSQSPHRRCILGSPPHRLSRHRSRSPLIQQKGPLLEIPSARKHRKPLFQSTAGKVYSSQLKSRNPPPKHDRYHYIANAASKKQNVEEDDKRFVAITKRVNEQFNSKQSTIGKVYSSKLKNRNPPPKHDRFHYTANAASKKRNIEGEDDRRFVAITKRVNEQFNSKQRTRGVGNVMQEEQEKYSDKQSGRKAKDMFDQFKDQAKKFASENPNSARALNQILVSLGHTNKTDRNSSFTSSLDDLKKAFNPEDKLRLDAWCKNDVDFRIGDGIIDHDIPKLSSVLEQVKDLNQNLGILSQLAKLAKHLKSDWNDSNVTTMALNTLEKLVSKTVWPNSNRPHEDSQSGKSDTNQCYSPLPDDNYYNPGENADLSNDPKYMAIDYNHQKPAHKMDPENRSLNSPYRNDNHHRSHYDNAHAYKDEHWQDAYKGEHQQDAYKGEHRRDAYKGEHRRDAYKGEHLRYADNDELRRVVYKNEHRRDTYKNEHQHDVYKDEHQWDYETAIHSSHRIDSNHRQYQMSQSFEKGFHNCDDYYQSSSPRRHTRPCDSQEFNLMERECLGSPAKQGYNTGRNPRKHQENLNIPTGWAKP